MNNAYPISRFKFRRSAFEIISSEIKRRIFQRLTRDSVKTFLRGTDHISVSPQLFGMHEPAIKQLIEFFAVSGYSDFLVDVGANIGLTSCQSGSKFRQVHMFEPNPDCFSILKVNTKISLSGTECHLYEFGLGAESKSATLTVPINNWGGAFIRDKSNSYTDEVLAGKDGFDEIDAKNYFDVQIKIEKAEDIYRKLFKSLTDEKLVSGVIKIDVEGYEPTVLAAIAKTIPAGMQVMIVFECWDKDFDINSILSLFNGRAQGLKLVEKKPFNKNWPIVLKFISLLFHPKLTTEIAEVYGSNMSGDLIIQVARKN